MLAIAGQLLSKVNKTAIAIQMDTTKTTSTVASVHADHMHEHVHKNLKSNVERNMLTCCELLL